MRAAPSLPAGCAAVLLAAVALSCRGAGTPAEATATRPAPIGPRATPVDAGLARGVRLALFVRGLDRPLGLVAAPGDASGRLYVVEKTGRVRVLEDGVARPEPFLDLSDQVSGGAEQGLLGLAFHPAFQENRTFFVNFTDLKGDTRVVEWRAREGGPPEKLRDILRLEQPYANHNGGHLAFGPDGKLWVGTGDGGAANDPQRHAQNPDSRLGKMLRIDVDPPRPVIEIVQKGLRNPWRYSFDRKTGDLYIADVGQNRWEEVNVVPADALTGHDFGWNVLEGSHCLKAATCPREGRTPPVVEYGRGDGCSITGGAVYRGRALPALPGHYFYSDFCTGLLRSFRWSRERGVTDHTDWKAALDPEGELKQVAAFGEDAAGELYVVSLSGEIWRFERAEER